MELSDDEPTLVYFSGTTTDECDAWKNAVRQLKGHVATKRVRGSRVAEGVRSTPQFILYFPPDNGIRRRLVYPNGPTVSAQNLADFARGHHCVLFHMKGCGHCDDMMPEWKAFTSTSIPSVTVADYQWTNSKHLPDRVIQSFEVDGFPTVVHVSPEGKVTLFKGAERTAQYFTRFVKQQTV